MLERIADPAASNDREEPLLERGEELRTIADCLRAVTSGGEGRVLLIEGQPGVGKTTLLDRLIEESTGQAIHGKARGSGLEGRPEYGAVLDLLGPLVVDQPDSDDVFRGAAQIVRPFFERGKVPPGRDTGFALMHGLYWLCANLSQREPLVLAVDDAQWVDSASLRFLAHLSERVLDLRLMLALTRRTDEKEDLPGAFDQIAAGPASAVLHPRELSHDAVGRLVEAGLGAEPGGPAHEECWRLTGGNPFLVGELLATAEDAGARGDQPSWPVPDSVSRLTAMRVQKLPAEAQAVARAIAVLGENTTAAEIETVTGLDAASTLGAIDRLASAGLLREGSGFEFRHPIVGDAVSGSIATGEHALLSLEAAPAVWPRDPVRAGRHRWDARPEGPSPEDWVVPLLTQAAEAARSRGATEEAAVLLGRLSQEELDEPERIEVLAALGEILAQRGDPEAIPRLADAVELVADPVRRGRLALIQGQALFHLVALEECSRVCREALADLPTAERELALALEATALDADALLGVRRDRPGQLAVEVADASTPGERLVFAHVLADRAATGSATAAAIRADGNRVLKDGGFLDEAGPTSPTYIYLGTALAWAGAYREVLDITTRGIELGRQSGSPRAISYSAALRAGVALLAGDLDLAEEDSELVVADLPGGDPMAYAVALAWYIEASVERGETAQAREALDRSGLSGPLPELGTIDFLMLARGSLAIAEGDPERAASEYREVGERVLRAGYPNPGAMDWRSRLAGVLVDLGEPEEAARLAAEELGLARQFGAPRPVALALRAAALPEGDLAGLRESAELLEGVSPVEQAHSLTALGVAVHHQAGADGEPDEAREILYRAMDLAHRTGSSRGVEAAMAALRETGARPRRPAARGREALTPQERRVSQMAAEGQGNRQIAESLFLTRRTVEMHLSNAYAKLGISSRKELAGALRDTSR